MNKYQFQISNNKFQILNQLEIGNWKFSTEGRVYGTENKSKITSNRTGIQLG